MTDQQPHSEAEFDAFAEEYDRAIKSATAFSGLKTDFFTLVKADYLIDILRENFREPRTVDVLDVGCGIGNIDPYIRDHVRTLAGVDVSGKSVEVAKRRHPHVEYRIYDGHRLPWDDASFDVAFTICVMHHVPQEQWPHFAGEMLRVLRPGGVALVFEHNPLNPLTQRVVAGCEFDKNATLLRVTETEKLLSGAGFRDVRTGYILSIPLRGRLVRGLERLISRLPLGAQYLSVGRA